MPEGTQNSKSVPTDYVVSPWSGDDRSVMHRIRNAVREGDHKALPTDTGADETADTVIVGGGIAGLTVAAKLKNPNFILLERERELGGNAKSGQYEGIRYSRAAAYLVGADAPFGDLYAALGLKLAAVQAPTDTVLTRDSAGKDVLVGELLKRFDALRDEFTELEKSDDFPPSDTGEATEKALALDGQTFADFMARFDLPAPLVKLVECYSRSAMGTTMDQASAYAGVNFYSEIANDVYAFPGGNGAVAKALVEKIDSGRAGRLRTGCAVYRVTRQDGGFRIFYFDADGKPRAVQAKKVVVAVPYYFAARILDSSLGVSEELIEALSATEYSAYVVANLCFEGRLETEGYDHWMIDERSDGTSLRQTDFIQADWVVAPGERSKTHSVITVYAPLDTGWDRSDLDTEEEADRLRIAAAIVEKFHAFFPVPETVKLKEVRMGRYGHQFLSSNTGAIDRARGIKRLMGGVADGLVLAHSDGQGMPAIESAIIEALAAVTAVEGEC